MILTQSDTDRFWSNVDRRGEGECWPWTRCRRNSKKDYGGFKLNGKMESSHRVAWFLTNGPIPELFEGLSSRICHSCDNPWCCNPNHLFLGNQKINIKDSINKGRRKDLNRAVVSELQVKLINQDLVGGVLTQREIAKKFGVSHNTINRINVGKHWVCVK